ncbi:MAG TPA: LAGLIDADG family homing endonuclease [Oligoflexus sp.]|uniref:LAGLIDADG family homing endonuclease n=1 Tax=Oligoflexus sp. TaxID=1971216 RepID=UPI002D2B6E8E|nr:LAGLIDADG family homing endonuclease [Oligoflexus sp.]HYX39992.1 LAGLIDADG family homing endonuclease [Oligoflexus sp.]
MAPPSKKQQLLAAQQYMKENLPWFLNKDFSECNAHKLYPWQREFMLHRGVNGNPPTPALLTAANQVGKDLQCDALIQTPSGVRVYGDLKVGDYVFGRDGKPTRILDTKRFENQKCYRITFDDRTSIIAGEGHLWVCKGYDERFRKRYSKGEKTWANPCYNEWLVKTTREIIEEGAYAPETKAGNRFVIPIAEPVQYEEQDLFDPYLVGLLLGDGCITTRNIKLSTGDQEPADYISSLYDVRQEKNKRIDYAIKGNVPNEVEKIGLIGTRSATKFIPEPYLVGSIEQRKALLAGLLDSDGSIYGKGTIEYSSISEKLANDVAELVRSLGGKAEIRDPRITRYTHQGEKKDGKPSYRVFIKTLFNPFRIKRKADRWYVTRYKHERVIYSIEPIESVPTMCITVDNQDSTYLIGREYIVTHNSSGQIVKMCNMAMRQDLWPYWFPKRKPTTFFYCYPDAKLATTEFKEKIEKVYLSKNEMKDDSRYGWKPTYNDKGFIDSIVFNSGVTCYFRFYSQSPTALQASSLDAVFLDEEPPGEHWDELGVRTQAMAALGSGYIHCVFTATLGQEWLFNAMEMQGTALETIVGAWKKQISAYDCVTYCDGSPSDIYTVDYIDNVLKPRYRSERERQRRIMGKFVKDSGLVYQEFEKDKHTEAYGETDMQGWRNYVGIDYGSGGDWGHSSAIVHVKVDPTYSKARVVNVWTSQKRRMTQADLLLRYKEMAPMFGVHQAFGDWAAVDLFTLAAREGIRLEKALKDHDVGIPLLNTLFGQGQLKVVVGPDSHAVHLVSELSSISEDTNKKHRVDDCADALRYALALCPMRLTALKLQEKKKREDTSKMDPRMAFYKGLDMRDDPMRQDNEDWDDLQDAIDDFEEFI